MESKESDIIVLMYHRFDEKKYPSTSISNDLFNSHIQFLIKKKIPVLPLTDLPNYLNSKNNLPKKSVFITIDDAYKSFYHKGFPILKKNKLPFSVFVSSDYVSDDKNSDYMSWEMLKEISKNSGLILNHSKSHKSLLEINNEELIEEVLENQKIIEKQLGVQPKIFSYPFGESNINIEKILESLDYKVAFSQHSAPLSKNENKYRLPRFSLNDEFGEIERFKLILKSKSLNITENSYKNTIVQSNSFIFSFKSELPSKMINCFINNSATLEKKNIGYKVKLIIDNLKKGKRYRINCTSVDEKGNIFWFGKMLKRVI